MAGDIDCVCMPVHVCTHVPVCVRMCGGARRPQVSLEYCPLFVCFLSSQCLGYKHVPGFFSGGYEGLKWSRHDHNASSFLTDTCPQL